MAHDQGVAYARDTKAHKVGQMTVQADLFLVFAEALGAEPGERLRLRPIPPF